MCPLHGKDSAWQLSLRQEAPKNNCHETMALYLTPPQLIFAFFYWSLVSQMLLFVFQQGHKAIETLQSSMAFAGLHTTTLDHYFPLSCGHWKKQILICGCRERRQNLLHPPFLSFAFYLCIKGGFSSERAQVLLDFWWDFPGIHTRLMSKWCGNGQFFCSSNLIALRGWKYFWLRYSWRLFQIYRYNPVCATKRWV